MESRFQEHFVEAMAIPHKSAPFEELGKAVKFARSVTMLLQKPSVWTSTPPPVTPNPKSVKESLSRVAMLQSLSEPDLEAMAEKARLNR